MFMAVKKKRKAVKRSAPKKSAKSKLYGMDNDFMIISGGGLVIIVIALALVYYG